MTIQGTNGAVPQMFNHGTSTAMMFLAVGVLYERSHHRWIVRLMEQKVLVVYVLNYLGANRFVDVCLYGSAKIVWLYL